MINTILLSLGNYGGSFLDMATLAIIARHIPVSEFGILSVVMAIAFLVFQVLDLGLSTETTRMVAVNCSEHTLSLLWTVRFCLCAAGSLLIILIGSLWQFSTSTVVSLFGLVFATEYLSDWAIALLRGCERFDQEAGLNLFGKTVLILCICFQWLLGNFFLTSIGVSFLVANAVKMTTALLVARKHRRFGWHISSAWKYHLLRSSPLGMANLLTQAILRSDLFVVMTMLGAAMAGAYGAALTLANGLAVLWSAMLLTYFPKFISSFKEDPQVFWHCWKTCWRATLLLTGGCALILAWPFPMLMGLVYGPTYSTGVFSRWFLLSSMGAALSSVCNMGLTTLSLSHVSLWTHVGVLGLSILFNVLLIAVFGLNGAAAAAALTHLVKAGWLYVCFTRRFKRIAPKRETLSTESSRVTAVEVVRGGNIL